MPYRKTKVGFGALAFGLIVAVGAYSVATGSSGKGTLRVGAPNPTVTVPKDGISGSAGAVTIPSGAQTLPGPGPVITSPRTTAIYGQIPQPANADPATASPACPPASQLLTHDVVEPNGEKFPC